MIENAAYRVILARTYQRALLAATRRRPTTAKPSDAEAAQGGGPRFENSGPEEFGDRLIADFPEQSDRLANLSTPKVRRDTDPLLPKTSFASWQSEMP